MKQFDAIEYKASVRKTITLFLTIILLSGTIASFYSSSSLLFTNQVHAISEYGNRINYDNYKSTYSSFEKEDVKCNNFNLNLNGLDVAAIPEPLGSLLGENQTHVEDKDLDTITFYGKDGKERFVGYNDKDSTFVCKNNNNNELIVSPTPPLPPTPPTPLPTVNNVCTVWEDDTPGNFDIFFAVSTNGGLTFSDPENLSEGNTQDSFDPQVICEGETVYVVWYEYTPDFGTTDIFFARSIDGGLTFSDPENLSEENTGDSFVPRISSDGENVYVVWQDYTPDFSNSDIFFARSIDGGLTFSDPENLSEENTGFSELPQISSDGENVYVVWYDDTPGNSDIFFARSIDGGLTFSDPENLSEENTGNAFDPQISSSSSSSRSGFLSNMNNSHQQLSTNDISHTKNTTIIKSLIQEKLQQKQIVEQQNIQTNKIKTSSLPTGPLIYDIPKH